MLINLKDVKRSEFEIYSNRLSEKSLSTRTLWIEKISKTPFYSIKLFNPFFIAFADLSFSRFLWGSPVNYKYLRVLSLVNTEVR